MANNTLNCSIIAKAAVAILDNELTMASKVFRGFEDEFNKSVNGYTPGQTISIKRPPQFTYRSGNVASAQDVVEGTTSITVNNQGGVDFALTSVEQTMHIKDISARIIRPAMVPVVNEIDASVMALVHKTWNWVGTAGGAVNTYAKFLAGTERMNQMAVPADMRNFATSPIGRTDILGAQSGMYVEKIAGRAYRDGEMGSIDNVSTFWSQNVPTLTTGSRTNGAVNGADQNVAYSGAQLTSYTQSLIVDGLGAAGTVKAGEVFTIAGVYAVNPATKATLPFLQQFVVTADATASGGGGATLTISPQIISSGAFKTVSATPADNAVITWVGSASTAYQTPFMFHRNAFALAMVPLAKPDGAVDSGSASYKGYTVRVVKGYDITNDKSIYRLDVLWGVTAQDPRLAVRVSG